MTPLEIRTARVPCGGRVAFGVAGSGPGFLFTPGHVCLSDFRNTPWVQDVWLEMARTHTFVTYDHLGGGLSSREPRDYSIEGLCAELDAVIDGMGCEQVVLFTCSTDTPSVVHFAATRPERVSALIIANGWPRGAPPTQQAIARNRTTMDDWDVASHAIARLFMNWSATEAERVREFVKNATTLEIYLEYGRSTRRHDASADLEFVEAPTLVLYTPNLYWPIEVSQEMVDRVPDARLQLIDAATSFRPLLESTQRFLLSLEPARSGHATSEGMLSAREMEVLAHIARGESNSAIAAQLTLSPRTIERHAQNIYAKLGVHNRVEASRWALEHGMH
jgi:DNA-binding CsgD family transcriptional regulator/pimeloyl-ACP methyl ester carboxylesterase